MGCIDLFCHLPAFNYRIPVFLDNWDVQHAKWQQSWGSPFTGRRWTFGRQDTYSGWRTSWHNEIHRNVQCHTHGKFIFAGLLLGLPYSRRYLSHICDGIYMRHVTQRRCDVIEKWRRIFAVKKVDTCLLKNAFWFTKFLTPCKKIGTM